MRPPVQLPQLHLYDRHHVVYIDDYIPWTALDRSLRLKARRIALSADFYYDMTKIQGSSPNAFDQLGWSQRARRGFHTSTNSSFFHHALICCPELESLTVILIPPGEEHATLCRPCLSGAMP